MGFSSGESERFSGNIIVVTLFHAKVLSTYKYLISMADDCAVNINMKWGQANWERTSVSLSELTYAIKNMRSRHQRG